jgi:hypothetical protein
MLISDLYTGIENPLLCCKGPLILLLIKGPNSVVNRSLLNAPLTLLFVKSPYFWAPIILLLKGPLMLKALTELGGPSTTELGGPSITAVKAFLNSVVEGP